MKHALIVALLAVPFAHATDKTERKPSSLNQFKDGSTVEDIWISGEARVIQIHDSSGRTCYGIAYSSNNGGAAINCISR